MDFGAVREFLRDEFRMISARFILFALLSPAAAFSYTLNQTDSGMPVKWRYGQKLYLAGNPSSATGFSEDSFRAAVVQGLQQWNLATRGLFDFEYWQGKDPAIYEPNTKMNGLSSIFFASNSSEWVDPNVIGFTQVWYNSSNGNLLETDIILNDRNYELTTVSSDSSYQSKGMGTRPKVYLNNIVTHELGHAIGLSHSGEFNSSMLYVEFLDQANTSCDDVAAARHLYSSINPGEGSLSGFIAGPSGEGIAGVQVTAISKSRGVPLASVLTDQGGAFHFGSIEAGSVALQVQPFQGSPSSVPASVQTRNQTVCSGVDFPIQFSTLEDGHGLVEYRVENGRSSQAGTIHLTCTAMTGSGDRYASVYAPEMLVDSGPLQSARSYFFKAHGPFKVTGLGYLLLSPVRVDLEVKDESGKALPLTPSTPLYRSDSGYQIPDTEVTGSAEGDIEVRVTPTAIIRSPFPFPSIRQSSNPYYVVSFTTTPLAANPRCKPAQPPKSYQSPTGDPIRFNSTQSAREGIGFCGTPNANAAGRGRHESPPHAARFGSILGWFLPFLGILVFQLNSKLRRARLRTRWISDQSPRF